MSPAPSASQPTPGTGARKSSIIKLNLHPSKLSEIQSAPPNPSAIMSDGESVAGEMSDSAGDHKRKSIKLRVGSGPSHSPSASRAGSPAQGSRAGSPAAPAGSQSQGQQSMHQIYPSIPSQQQGVSISPKIYGFGGYGEVVPPQSRFIQRQFPAPGRRALPVASKPISLQRRSLKHTQRVLILAVAVCVSRRKAVHSIANVLFLLRGNIC
jgi:hypothetical protein